MKKVEEAGKALDIRGIIGNPKNRVARLGVELEGGWAKVPPGVNLERDGSVFHDNPPPGVKAGEIPIGPMEPGALPKSMRKYYPQVVDDSCGMHVHMSFKTLRHYGWLMDTPDYQETIIEWVTEWAKKEGFPPGNFIFQRLAGKVPFCQKKFWPDSQVRTKAKDHDQRRDGHRYTIVHYCGRQNTIEIRVLPMFKDVEQAIRAVKLVVDITNACLVVLSERDSLNKIKNKLEMNSGFVCEEHEIEIPLTPGQRKRLRP